MLERTNTLMLRATVGATSLLSEPLSFYLKSAGFMTVMGVLLYVSMAAAYPAVHDAMHDFRHALSIVPCH